MTRVNRYEHFAALQACATIPPAFEVEDQVEAHGRWRCTLASGRTYAVVPVDGGFRRGHRFGKTIEQAMVGAQL